MAISRFSFVPQQPIQNTYAPLPFQEMALAGASLQKEQDDANVDLEAADKLFKVPNLEFQKHYDTARAKEQEYHNALRGISDELSSGKINAFEAKQKASGLLQQFQSDPIVRGLTQDVEQRKAQLEHLKGQKEKANAKIYDPYNKWVNSFDPKNKDNRYVAALNPREIQDYVTLDMQPTIDNMIDSYVKDKSIIPQTDKYGTITYKSTLRGGLSRPAIRARLESAPLTLLTTQRGAYWLDENLRGKTFNIGKGKTVSFDDKDLNFNELTKEQREFAVDEYGNQLVDLAYSKLHTEREDAIDVEKDPQGVEKADRTQVVPYYKTEGLDVKGLDLDPNAFKPRTKTNYSGVMGAPGYVYSPGKFTPADKKYNTFKELPEKEQKFTTNIAKTLYPEFYAKDKSGKATQEEYKDFYGKLEETIGLLNKDLKEGSFIIPFTKEEKDREVTNLFGTGNNSVKDLGTGIAVNTSFLIPSISSSPMTYAEMSSHFKPDSKVEVSGFIDPKNPMPTITGDKGFRNAKGFAIEGTTVYMTGPEGYLDKANKYGTPEEHENLKINNIVSDIHQISYRGKNPVKMNVHGVDTYIDYIPDNNNPDVGHYRLKIGDMFINQNTADEVEETIRFVGAYFTEEEAKTITKEKINAKVKELEKARQ